MPIKGATVSTVNETAAKLTQQASDKLVKNLNAMPAEKQQWKPPSDGRSAHEQVLECAVINGMAAKIFTDQAFPNFETMDWGGMFGKAAAQNDTTEKLIATLEKATADLVAATKAFPADKLGEMVTVPFDGSVHTWAEVIFFPYWNMTYHEGQINYIQLLYGDKEYHA